MTLLRPIAVCLALCAWMMVPAGVAAAAYPGANGRIAYGEPWRDNNGRGFWSSRPDGTRQRQILQRASSLNFSADGRQVVFTSVGGIGLARANGSEQSWLLGHAPVASDPYWAYRAALSPDGKRAAFTVEVSTRRPFRYGWDSYVIGADGKNRRLIARDGTDPVFSPDGTRVAYIKHIDVMGGETHQTAIETIAVDGTKRRRLHTYPERNDYGKMTFPSPAGLRTGRQEAGGRGVSQPRLADRDRRRADWRSQAPARA